MQSQSTEYSFQVDPAEIDTFVAGVQRLETTMAQHVQAFEALRLDSGVFGRLPSISGKMHDAYSKHVEEGSKALAEGQEVLRATGETGESTAQAYRWVEQVNIKAVAGITDLLTSGEDA